MFSYNELKQDLLQALKDNRLLNETVSSSGEKTLTVPLGIVRDQRFIMVSFSFDKTVSMVYILAGVELKRVTPALQLTIQRANRVLSQDHEPMQLEIKGNSLLCNRIIKNDGRYGSLDLAPLATQQTDCIEAVFNNVKDI